MQIVIDNGSTVRRGGLRGRAAAKRTKTAGEDSISVVGSKGALGGGDKECACPPVDLADQPEHAAAVLDSLGVALLNRGCLADGAKLIERALRIRQKHFGDEHPATAMSFNSFARVQRERGELAQAEQTSAAALRINRAAFGELALPIAVSLVELGVIHLQQGRYADAERAAVEGFTILQKLKIDHVDPNASRLLDIRARAEAARDAPEAAATFEAAIALDRAQVGTQHPKYATHASNYALYLEQQADFRRAEAIFLKSIGVYANVLKRRCHPNLIDMHANLGSLYLARNRKGDLKLAARYLQEALRLNLKVRGDAHLLVANDYANLGRYHYANDDAREALRHFLAALKIYDRAVRRGSIPEDYLFRAEVLTWIGRLLVETDSKGDAARAQPLLEHAVQIWERVGAPGKVGALASEAALARAWALQDVNQQQADALMRRAYDGLKAELGADYPFVQIVAEWLASSD